MVGIAKLEVSDGEITRTVTATVTIKNTANMKQIIYFDLISSTVAKESEEALETMGIISKIKFK